MQIPANVPLYGDRNVLFDATVAFIGFDFTGAAAKFQVRTAPDAPGAALISLTTGAGLTWDYTGTDTVANHIAAGRLTDIMVPAGYDLTDNMTMSLLNIRVSKAIMALASVPADEQGDEVALAYDILITPVGSDEDKYAYGPFIVRGTVTQ